MTNALLSFIQWLVFLWLLEKILKVKIIMPLFKYGKLAIEWTLSGLTVAVSAAVALSSLLCRLIPPVVQWLRSVRR